MPDTEVCTSDVGEAAVALCVLASGSKGNCSVIRLRTPSGFRCVLIDAGLTPRRTDTLLRERGLSIDVVDEIIFTHLDTDHCCPTWVGAMPAHGRFRLHRRHRGAAHRMGLTVRRTEYFEDEGFETPHTVRGGALRARPILLSHDEHGVAVFRFETACGRSLGFATDLGRATEAMVAHLAGVDVLAIESNYCPRMQVASGRPAYLKQRIMGGAGHLSNEQCAEAVRRIAPRERVALLHLSQECNEPARAAAGHREAAYAVTLTGQDEATGWIPVACDSAPARAGRVEVVRGHEQTALFAG